MRYSHFALHHSLGLKNTYQNWSKQGEEATVIVQFRGNRITQESTDTLICTPSGPEGHTKATKESSVSPWRAKAHFWQLIIMYWILQGLPQKPHTALCEKGAVRVIKIGVCLGQQGHSNVKAGKKYFQFNVCLKLPKGTINGKHCLK